MDHYVTAETVRSLREKKNYTQKQLGDMIGVSDKTVSKWETGKGLPDITLLEPLSSALGVSVSELLRGEPAENRNRGGNLQRGRFFVCPLCGNVIYAVGNADISCCGIHLPPLEAENADDAHLAKLERIENEYYISFDHPMTKEHHISFVAQVSGDQLHIVKWYPEQDPACRLPLNRRGKIYLYCNHHGLMKVDVKL